MVEFDEIYSMLFSGSIGLPAWIVTAGQGHNRQAERRSGTGWFDVDEVVA